ncbi:hypothetical protein EDB89DRAFT_262471 [Lactarius sanguifluus]|nr:hypothetical protein EDB89DRAFT_262471 [Lactarius sanguifluus]
MRRLRAAQDAHLPLWVIPSVILLAVCCDALKIGLSWRGEFKLSRSATQPERTRINTDTALSCAEGEGRRRRDAVGSIASL